MIGAIAGDIIGSPYERARMKSKDFPLFSDDSRYTDDTILTIATSDALLTCTSFEEAYRRFYKAYPDVGYGTSFISWARSENPKPYGSYGNGSAMRVSPIGLAFGTMDKVLSKAKETAECTHDHPEGIKGAQAIAAAVFLARQGEHKNYIKNYIERMFGYDLDRKLDDIRPNYHFDVTCQGSVPEAIISFLESHDYESAVRNAISLGGDSDTLACMAGSIAGSYYGDVPGPIKEKVIEILKRPVFFDEKVNEELCEYIENFMCNFYIGRFPD